MTDARAQFIRALEESCSMTGDQRQSVERYRQLMKDNRCLEVALSIVEGGAGEAEARTRWLVLSFIKDMAMRSSLFVRLPSETLPTIAARFYRILLSLFEQRCQHDTNASKQHFRMFGDVVASFGLFLKVPPDTVAQWAEPGFQLISSQNVSHVIFGLEFLEIMLGMGSHEFVHLYLQRVAVLLRSSPSLPVFIRVFETWLAYVHLYPKDYVRDESHIVLDTALHFIGSLSVACEQRRVITDEWQLTLIMQAARLLRLLISYLHLKDDPECTALFQAVLTQSIGVLVRAAVVAGDAIPGRHSRDLLSVLLFTLWNKLPSDVIQTALPQLCAACLKLCILYDDDLEERDVNQIQFYDTVYPSGAVVCPVTDGHPRRVAMEFLRWLAGYHLRGVLDVLLDIRLVPPGENVIYALRVLGKQLRKLEGPNSAEWQQEVAAYLRNVLLGEQPAIATCTAMSAISRFAYCLPQDFVKSLVEKALRLVCAHCPGQQNENIFFFTVGCDVLYRLVKLSGFEITNRDCRDLIAHRSEFTANAVGIKLLRSMDLGAELLSLITRLITSLHELLDEDADSDETRIEAIVDLLCDKVGEPIQLPTELLCHLYRDRLSSDHCDRLLMLARDLFWNQNTPDLYLLLNVILETLNGENAIARYRVFGTELALAFCSFITCQLRSAPPELVGRLFETVMLLVRSADFVDDFKALIRVFAAMFQARIVEPRVLSDVMNIITQSDYREECVLEMLEIWASACAVYQGVHMPPEDLKLFVQALSENKFATNYLHRLSILCLENHRDCWAAELGSLDDHLAAVRMSPVANDPDEPDMPLGCDE